MTAGFVRVTIEVAVPGRMFRTKKVVRLLPEDLLDKTLGNEHRRTAAKNMIGLAFMEAYGKAIGERSEGSTLSMKRNHEW